MVQLTEMEIKLNALKGLLLDVENREIDFDKLADEMGEVYVVSSFDDGTPQMVSVDSVSLVNSSLYVSLAHTTKALTSENQILDVGGVTTLLDATYKAISIECLEYENRRNNLKKKYLELIECNGNPIKTFQLCADNGYSLDESTIDSIELSWDGDDVIFNFNDNDKYDFDRFNDFSLIGLEKFYNDISKHFKVK